MKRFFLIVSSVSVLCIGFLGLASTQFASALPLGVIADAKSDVCSGIGLTSTACGNTSVPGQANTILSTIVNLFSVIVGISTVVMIMIAGIKYTTSGGDSSKTANAKTTLIYALVGLVVVAASQAVVHFVLNNIPAL